MKKRFSTKNKVSFLQKYLNDFCEEWIKIHPGNISGFRIDKKKVKGKQRRNYAIIFHVVKKLKVIDNQNKIPEYFEIQFPDGKNRKIWTDVEETGKFEFHIGIGDQINCDLNIDKHGSLGLFLKDENDRVFVLTNYHVVAESLMNQKIYSYQRLSSQNNYDVKIIDSSDSVFDGIFDSGIITDELDVAFVEIFLFPDNKFNTLPNGSNINGYLENYPSIGLEATVYSLHNKHGKASIIMNNSNISFTTSNFCIKNIISIKRCTNSGDSGGLVVTSANEVLGIIVGADLNYSYVIPYFKIHNYNPLVII